MALTPELREYFDSLEEVFGTPGWTILIEDAKREVYQLQADALDAPDWETLLTSRGRAQQLAEFIRLPEQVEGNRASHEEEDDADLSV